MKTIGSLGNKIILEFISLTIQLVVAYQIQTWLQSEIENQYVWQQTRPEVISLNAISSRVPNANLVTNHVCSHGGETTPLLSPSWMHTSCNLPSEAFELKE